MDSCEAFKIYGSLGCSGVCLVPPKVCVSSLRGDRVQSRSSLFLFSLKRKIRLRDRKQF